LVISTIFIKKKWLSLFYVFKAKVPVKCTWTGFQDNESPIEKFVIFLGSQEGFSDVFSNWNSKLINVNAAIT
jgi:hypothetical protein